MFFLLARAFAFRSVHHPMNHQLGQHSPASAFTAIYHTLRNEQTGMYLGAHTDGLLIAEDNDTNHHDIEWKIVPGHSGTSSLFAPGCDRSSG